jgi:hypothetical protein
MISQKNRNNIGEALTKDGLGKENRLTKGSINDISNSFN